MLTITLKVSPGGVKAPGKQEPVVTCRRPSAPLPSVPEAATSVGSSLAALPPPPPPPQSTDNDAAATVATAAVVAAKAADMPLLAAAKGVPAGEESTLLAAAADAVAAAADGASDFKAQIVWPNVFVFVLLHSSMLYGIYVALFHAMFKTWLFAFVIGQLAGLGVTAGAHRLWSHRSYKARLPLRIVLMIFNCFACQNDLYEWTRDHRVHHKFSETDADPHNVNRGFFFAHVGWLMCKKHPEVFRRGRLVDCSDLMQDPVVRFQRRFYVPLTALLAFYLPAVLPHHLYGESYWNAFFVATMLRYVFSLHFTWLVNSVAHLWGNKPYDRHISPVENAIVSLLAIGEGFHNYHHTFPWDYRTSEFGWKINLTSMFIDAMAKIGLAYDLKTVPESVVRKRMERTGDGTRHCFDSPAAAADRAQSFPAAAYSASESSDHHWHGEVSYEEVFGSSQQQQQQLKAQ